MKVYELVQTIGYTRNILDHFDFVFFKRDTESMFTIRKPTADEYVHICGRDILEWSPCCIGEKLFDEDSIRDTPGIEIYIPMFENDYEIFDQLKDRR